MKTKKTILVTGGAGFMGSNFVRHLYEKYPSYRILVLDALTYAGSVENLPVDINANEGERLSFWYGDVRNGELVDTLVEQSDAVVHFAAETHVTRSIYDNLLFFETDVLGTQTVANAVLKYRDRIERFIHISSSEVYGTALTPKMGEDHPLVPLSPYAAAKAGADRLVYSYWTTYEVPAVILRPFNNFGPYQHLEKAIPRFITSCILGDPIRLHGDGMAARDYVYVKDLCAAVDKVLHANIAKVRGQIFNIGAGTHRSMLSIARTIVKMMGKSESLITFIGDRPGQVFRHTGDIGRIRKVLGWRPRVTWERGLQETIDWYRHNREIWSKQLWMRTVPIITKTGKRELH
ncbi:MAG: dTDP-glucose 4,6-dehydratase [Elusimicrobia bacterium]|nr:dTDP-glucose 4,6-dehydratase [Elusimicrobiota bacterium]